MSINKIQRSILLAIFPIALFFYSVNGNAQELTSIAPNFFWGIHNECDYSAELSNKVIVGLTKSHKLETLNADIVRQVGLCRGEGCWKQFSNQCSTMASGVLVGGQVVELVDIKPGGGGHRLSNYRLQIWKYNISNNSLSVIGDLCEKCDSTKLVIQLTALAEQALPRDNAVSLSKTCINRSNELARAEIAKEHYTHIVIFHDSAVSPSAHCPPDIDKVAKNIAHAAYHTQNFFTYPFDCYKGTEDKLVQDSLAAVYNVVTNNPRLLHNHKPHAIRVLGIIPRKMNSLTDNYQIDLIWRSPNGYEKDTIQCVGNCKAEEEDISIVLDFLDFSRNNIEEHSSNLDNPTIESIKDGLNKARNRQINREAELALELARRDNTHPEWDVCGPFPALKCDTVAPVVTPAPAELIAPPSASRPTTQVQLGYTMAISSLWTGAAVGTLSFAVLLGLAAQPAYFLGEGDKLAAGVVTALAISVPLLASAIVVTPFYVRDRRKAAMLEQAARAREKNNESLASSPCTLLSH